MSFTIGIRSAADARARTAIKTQPFSIAGQNAPDAPRSPSERIQLDIMSKAPGARGAASKRIRLDRRPKRRRDAPRRNARALAGVCAPRAPGGFFPPPPRPPPKKKRVRFDVRYRYHQIEMKHRPCEATAISPQKPFWVRVRAASHSRLAAQM